MPKKLFLQHLEAAEANPQAVTVHTLAWLIDALAEIAPAMPPDEWESYDARIGRLAYANAGTQNLAEYGHQLDDSAAELQALFEAVL